MERPHDIKAIFSKYIELYPHEVERQKSFESFIGNTTFRDLYNRKNFKGHITASAFIVNPIESTLLLIHHKILNRWLQPGGHVDYSDDSILQAAFRESEEETNIDRKHLKLLETPKSAGVPLDIDSHIIPKNPKKKELQHVHHDIRFLFLFDGQKKVNINKDEVESYKWKLFSELNNDDTFSKVIPKIKTLLNFKT